MLYLSILNAFVLLNWKLLYLLLLLLKYLFTKTMLKVETAWVYAVDILNLQINIWKIQEEAQS